MPAIPGGFIGDELEPVVHFPGAELVVAADEAGATRAAVEPQHDGRFRDPAVVSSGFVET